MNDDRMRFYRTRIWITGLVLTLGLGLLHAQILTRVAGFMTIRDPLEHASFILPLYQEGYAVPAAAAELYRRGYAHRVALLRTQPTRLEVLGLLLPPHEVWRRILEAEGVPPEAIVLIASQIANEVELAHAVAAFLGSREKNRIIVVASAPRSRLSRFDLRRGLAGFPIELRIYPVQPTEFDEHSWWRSRHGWITYFDAYLLLALRLFRD